MPAAIYVSASHQGSLDLSRNPIVRPSSTSIANISKPESVPRTIDALLRLRAISHPQDHIVSYPKSGIDFVDYNLQQLDVFAWRVANHYEQHIPARKSSKEKPHVVALLGVSNFEYLITLLALIKLGHTVLLLSTRITVPAIESLINATSASTIIVDRKYLSTAREIQNTLPLLQLFEVIDRRVFEFSIEAHGDTQLDSDLDPEIEEQNIALIVHSSGKRTEASDMVELKIDKNIGSTGHPKPIFQTHKSCLANYANSMKMKSFITMPLFHNYGICSFFRALHCRKPIHFYNAELPLTQEYLLKIFQANNFEIFYGVPYTLKLLSESQTGISLLSDLKLVMYGGSACPDDLGNLLVENGVNLMGHYGA